MTLTKQACWATLKTRPLTYGPSFIRSLIDLEEAKIVVQSARKKLEMTSEIQAQTSVFEYGANFWREVKSWGMEHRKLSPKEAETLDTCAAQYRTKLPTEWQCAIAMDVLGRLRADGFQPEEEATVF